ncbi:hypothetical protein [uncultured Bacteroides sp.]|uniref:hypothetical protein n=1 Tax=uncultured Bacteroides sp. TaxID=162156 RepID=UPI00262A90AA|nr:hypothetical protein [uncultured Bacteroides sp.]
MKEEVKAATSNEIINEANNASSVELIDIVKELTIKEGHDMEIDDAIDNLGFNL